MAENTESGRRKNWNDGETEKKRKSCSRRNGVETKPETNEASQERAEEIPKTRLGPELRPSSGLAAECARYRGRAAPLDFQNQGATNRNATHPCGPRPYASRKSVRPQNVRPRSARPRCRAVPVRVRAHRLRLPKPELCAPDAQGRQFVWPWPSHPQGIYFQFTPVRVPRGKSRKAPLQNHSRLIQLIVRLGTRHLPPLAETVDSLKQKLPLAANHRQLLLLESVCNA
jgi:hypothetical protein